MTSPPVRVCTIRTGRRVISAIAVSFLQQESPAGTVADNEGDSNADTCCLGTNFIVLEMTNRTAEVYPYDSSYDPIENVPIVSGATAYDDKTNGSTYILVFFYGKKLEHSLINPNQVRDHGLEFWDDPFDKRQELAIIIDDDLRIPLSYNGTRLSFKSRVPTRDELTNCQHIDMTSTSPWEPSQVRLGQVVRCTRRHI